MASPTAADSPSPSPICFGNVIKLVTQSSSDKNGAMGFLEQKNGKVTEYLLVMGPMKESVKDKVQFQEAEFIVAPIRCEKPPADGTPLKYKQPFVLTTSSPFEVYSLNNKMNAEDTIGLQCRDVKGEMYVAFEKEGYTMEANVMSGDLNLDLVVVDSHRMRKKYNKKLAVHTKGKALVHSGFVTCGSKGKPMSLSIVKVDGAMETTKFVRNEIARRRSTLTSQQAQQLNEVAKEKADEASQPTHTGDGGAETPTGAAEAAAKETKETSSSSGVSAPGSADATPRQSQDALVDAPTTADGAAAPVVTAESSHAATPATVSTTTESTAATSEVTPGLAAAETAMDSVAAAAVTTPAADLAAEPALEEKAATVSHAHAEEKITSASPALVVLAEQVSNSAVKAAATPSSTPGATPQAAAGKVGIPQSPTKLGEQQLSSATLTSEAEGGDEKIDSNCLGENKCAIM